MTQQIRLGGMAEPIVRVRWSFGAAVPTFLPEYRDGCRWTHAVKMALRLLDALEFHGARDVDAPNVPHGDRKAVVTIAAWHYQAPYADESGIVIERDLDSTMPAETFKTVCDRIAAAFPVQVAPGGYRGRGWVARGEDRALWSYGNYPIGD